MLSSYECYAGLSDNDSISSMPYFVQVFNFFIYLDLDFSRLFANMSMFSPQFFSWHTTPL